MVNIEKAKQIDGWMSDSELHWLASMAQKSKVIIEVGCYHGRSTRALADNTSGIVHAVDPWDGIYHKDDNSVHFVLTDGDYDIFLYNTRNLSNIIIHRGTLSDLIDTDIKADFIFIDGDHRYEGVKSDILNARKLLVKDGILAGHDYIYNEWPGVRKAVDELIPKIQVLDSIWISKN